VLATPEEIGIEAVAEVGPGGHFFAAATPCSATVTPSTLRWFRTGGTSVPGRTWRQDRTERANSRWRETLASFQPPALDPACMNADVVRERRRQEGGAARLLRRRTKSGYLARPGGRVLRAEDPRSSVCVHRIAAQRPPHSAPAAALTGTTAVCHTSTCSAWKLTQCSSNIVTPLRPASALPPSPAEQNSPQNARSSSQLRKAAGWQREASEQDANLRR